MKRLFASILFAMAAAACGGKVVFETGEGGSGGSTNVTTTTGAGTTSSSKSSTSSGPATTSTGGLQDCSAFGFLGINASCSQEGVTCLVPHSCCQTEATCTKGQWIVTGGVPCGALCVDCGPTLGCESSAICVMDQLDVGSHFRCETNPCQGSPLSCGCAGPACAPPSLHCAGPTSPTTLVCDCPNC